MQQQERIDSFARFHVVFEPLGTLQSVMLRSASDADLAMLAFHDEWERLKQEEVAGDLLLVSHAGEARTLLRESLGADGQG